jgi:hypothetical protein
MWGPRNTRCRNIFGNHWQVDSAFKANVHGLQARTAINNPNHIIKFTHFRSVPLAEGPIHRERQGIVNRVLSQAGTSGFSLRFHHTSVDKTGHKENEKGMRKRCFQRSLSTLFPYGSSSGPGGDQQSPTTNLQTVAAARVPRLKPGATCDRRSAAKTGDSEYLPTGEHDEHHPSDEPDFYSAHAVSGLHIASAPRTITRSAR